MNTETQQKVLQWIQATTDKIQDFAIAEIPPFIHEYLNWKFWEAGIEIVVYVLVMVLIWTMHYIFGMKLWLLIKSFRNPDIEYVAPISLTAGCILITFLCFPYGQIKDCIQIKIAPKIFLVEKATELIKK